MGFFEDFLQQNQNNPLVQRLVQHIAAQIDPYQQTAALATQGQLPLAALKGLQTVVTTAPKAATDTVGLGLEGFANIAQAATGGGLLTLADHADQIPGLSANDKMVLQQAAAIARAGQHGPIGDLQGGMDITNYVRQHADTPLAWGTGAATLGLDLSNFLPFAKVEEPLKAAVKPVGQAVIRKVGPKVAELAPETAAKIANSPVAKKVAPEVAKVLGEAIGNTPPAGTVNPDGTIEAAAQAATPQVEQAVARLTGAAGAAPEAAAPAAATPLKTIFGQDASVVHSGTYPGLPKSAPAPDVQQAVAQLTGEAPASKQAAVALAPDASINDKMNALEQNPNLPVPQGSAPSINTFSKLFEAAYGSAKKEQRQNAIPAMAKMLGATYRTDGTFWRNGVDVTQPALDFLAQRVNLGNDRKAIAAARDAAKQAADQLVGDQGGGLPGQIPVRLAAALGGGAIGAGIGYHQNGTQGAIEGGLAGAAGTAGITQLATNQTLRDLALIGNEAGVKGMQDALQNGTFTLKGLAHDWSADKTKTVRGLALDTMTNYVRALVNKIPLADINASRADLIRQAKATGSTYNAGHPYTSMTADLFDKLGQDITQYDLHQAYGQGYLGSADSATKQLHPLASAAAGAGYSLASPVTYLTSGLGTAVAAARGAARPYTNAAFNAINDLEHNAARDAGFRLAMQQQLGQVAPTFLEQIKAAGGDIASLSADGVFSPKQAEAALPGAGAVWQDVLNQILGTPAQQAVKENAKKGIQAVAAAPQQDGLAAQFVKQAFGDYSTRSGLAKALGAVAPFSRYTLGQLPVLATLVAGHPGATLLVAKMLRDAGQRATQSGTPSYNANNLDVPKGTPVLGGLASIEAGGAPASGSINLLNSFSPVNVDIGSLGDLTDPKKTPYEKAVALMGAVGLQPNPLIQTAAYALGGTDIAPGAQSRFSGLENILGGPQLPTVKAPLDALRKALGNNPSSYDPYQVAAAEIVLQQTGKPIRDPSNHALAVQTLDPNSPLMQQAKAQVDQGNAVKNLVSGLSPVSLTTTTDTKAQYRQAKANDPRYTKEQIAQAAQVSMSVARQMQDYNAQIEAQNPALVTYSTPKLSSKDKEDPRLKAFDAKYGNLKDINPKLYAQLLAQYKQQVGLK